MAKKKKKYTGYAKNPMKEVMRINKMLSEISVEENVNAAIQKVNQVNNKIVENNTVQVANQLLANQTIIKAFTDDSYAIERYVEKEPVQVVDKPFVIGYIKDYSGCGHFRMIYPMNMINTKFSHTGKINCSIFPAMLTQDDVVPHVRAFVFQRPIGEDQVFKINAYKKFQAQYQYKLIAELDDYVFELPEYHPGHDENFIKNTRSLLTNLNNVDEVIVSTENLHRQLSALGVTSRIKVIKNYLPKHLYQTDVKRFRFNDITKPKIAFTGSNFHYNNLKKLDGDFSANIKEFIIKNIDVYDFIFFGDAPYFLKQFVDEGKIVIIPFTNPVEYANNLKKIRVDFVIAPLSENLFNACKSDLRYLEASAMGSIFIGSRFINVDEREGFTSPYQYNNNVFDTSTTVEQLEAIIEKFKNKDKFNEEISIQYDELEDRWLENPKNILEYVEVFSTGVKGLVIEEDHPQFENLGKEVK